jgi:hypothetical protein
MTKSAAFSYSSLHFGEEPCSPDERSDIRDRPPDIATGRAFARPVAHPGYGCCLFQYGDNPCYKGEG